MSEGKKMPHIEIPEAEEKIFKMPKCIFAGNICGKCYHNDGGWCGKHGGWVDYDKWACSDYA